MVCCQDGVVETGRAGVEDKRSPNVGRDDELMPQMNHRTVVNQ